MEGRIKEFRDTESGVVTVKSMKDKIIRVLDLLGMTYAMDDEEETIIIDITSHSYVMIDFTVMEVEKYDGTKIDTFTKFKKATNEALKIDGYEDYLL